MIIGQHVNMPVIQNKPFRRLTFLLTGILMFCCSGWVPACAQSYNGWVNKSFDYLDANRLDSAELALKEAMRLEPANPVNALLLSNLGTLQRRNGHLDEAMVSYTAALSRSPQHVTFLANRASLFLEMNKPENALIDYAVLLTQHPTDENALYQRGLIYMQLKNYEAAQADFERIIELNPQTVEGRMGIASLCKLRKEYDEAERLYIYLMDRIKDNAELYAGRAELYLLMSKTGKAMNDINRAIVLQPDKNPYAYIIRARVKLLQFEKEAAAADVNKALSMGYDAEEGKRLLALCQK
jgi:tetratricopeptide (TPR) repeat protein